MIEIKDIHKTYNINKPNAVPALQGVSLSVKQGEMVALMGTSGAGKSTLLHIIGCIETFEQGSYCLDGVDISNLTQKKLAQVRNQKIGFVMQDFALVPDYSVIENVMIPLFFHGDSRKQRHEKSMHALQSMGLESLAKRTVTQLSGGQKQRVAIARSIANNPNLILADEPTGALDSQTANEIMTVLEQLNEVGKTIIIVTHDHNIAKRCERLVNITDGRIVPEV